MLTTTELLPVILTIIGVGVTSTGVLVTLILMLFRITNQCIGETGTQVTRLVEETEARVTRLVSESEARLTQRIDAIESRMQRMEQETAEIKGALNVIQNALPLRIGEYAIICGIGPMRQLDCPLLTGSRLGPWVSRNPLPLQLSRRPWTPLYPAHAGTLSIPDARRMTDNGYKVIVANNLVKQAVARLLV